MEDAAAAAGNSSTRFGATYLADPPATKARPAQQPSAFAATAGAHIPPAPAQPPPRAKTIASTQGLSTQQRASISDSIDLPMHFQKQ